MIRTKVLFVCAENTGRSQMAKAFLNQMASDQFEAESGGFDRGCLNPIVVEAMREIGIDISKSRSRSVFELVQENRYYSYVVSVSNFAKSEPCPIFAGLTKRLSWSLEDPNSFMGPIPERLAKIRVVRDAIQLEVANFIKTYKEVKFEERILV